MDFYDIITRVCTIKLNFIYIVNYISVKSTAGPFQLLLKSYLQIGTDLLLIKYTVSTRALFYSNLFYSNDIIVTTNVIRLLNEILTL